MSSSPIVVRPFEQSDLPIVLEFLKTNFPEAPAKGNRTYFQWQFEKHPLGSSLDGYLLAWQGDRLLGQLASMRDRLFVDGNWVDVRWLTDLMIAPEERGTLAALRLFQHMMERPELLLTVGAGPAMQPLYAGLGWQQMQIAKTFYLPIRPRALMRMARATGREQEAGSELLNPKSLMAAVAGGVLHRVLPGVLRKQQANTAGVTCEAISEFTPELSDFLQNISPELGITPERTQASYQWKFLERPGGNLHAWVVRDAQSQAIRGVLCSRLAERDDLARWLEIVDLVALPADRAALILLLAAATTFALEKQLDFLRLRISRPEQEKQLPQPWWREYTLPVSDDIFAHSQNHELLSQLSSQPWYLTSVVSDRAEDGRAALPSEEAEDKDAS